MEDEPVVLRHAVARSRRAIEPPLTLRARVRARLRWAVLDVLGRTGSLRLPSDGHLRVIAYHALFAEEAEGFRRQLRYFRDNFRVRTLGEAVSALGRGVLDEPTLALTFDDGLACHGDLVAPLLEAEGMRGCFFVPAGFMALGPDDAGGRELFSRDRLRLAAPLANLGAAEVRALAARGHEIGSHTRTHRVVAELSRAEAREEIVGSKSDLEAAAGARVRFLAWPYGWRRHFSGEAADLARAAGYEATFSAVRGANRRGALAASLHRDCLEPWWPLRHVRYFLER